MFVNLIAKMPILVAMTYRYKKSLTFTTSDASLDYCVNFVDMMFLNDSYKSSSLVANVLDLILLLHSDHEQNASTSSVRLVGSSHTHPFAAIVGGIASLWGPLHGGANESVLKMLHQIGSVDNIEEYIAGVKSKKYKLMGFGHRVYKNMDPRATIIRKACYDILDELDKKDDPLFQLALKLEKYAFI